MKRALLAVIGLFVVSSVAAGPRKEVRLPEVTATIGYELNQNDYQPKRAPTNLLQAEGWNSINSERDSLISFLNHHTKDPDALAKKGIGFLEEALLRLHRIEEKAEKLHHLNPNDPAAMGLLGSSLVGEFFYPNYYSFIAYGKVADTAPLDKAISLLKEAKKRGHFPEAGRDLAVAYVFQNRYSEAFSEYKELLLRFPERRSYAEAVVALFAMQLQQLSAPAVEKLAKGYSALLSRWLSKTNSAKAVDHLFVAKIHNVAGEFEKMADSIHKGLKLFPNDPLLLEAQKAVQSRN